MNDNLIAKVLTGLSDASLDKIKSADADFTTDEIRAAYQRATGGILSNDDTERAETYLEGMAGLYTDAELDLFVENVKRRNSLDTTLKGIEGVTLAAQVGVRKMEESVEDQHDNITQLENTILGYSAATFNNYA